MAHASWGSGWPNCQVSKINKRFSVDTKQGTIKFPGGVRNEINELVSRLVKETVNRGYKFGRPGNPSFGCWGFACRPIRGKRVPSNHSWGLAVDINAPTNPMGAPLRTDMPAWMPDLWNAYGFRWGGDYTSRPDAMHYEFMGSVAEAVRLTGVARNNRLGEGSTPPKPKPPQPKPVYGGEEDMIIVYDDGRGALLLFGGKLVRVESHTDWNELRASGLKEWPVSDAQLKTLKKAYGPIVDA